MKTKKKPGLKPGSTITYYTPKEHELIRTTVLNGKKNKDNAAYLAKKLKRSEASIMQKIVLMKRELGLIRGYGKEGKESKSDLLRSVTLPKNIALEFEASRAVLKENRIIIYFK